MSLPSTRTPGMPYPTALDANVFAAVCLSRGTLMAQPLFRQMNTQGAFHTPAKFMPTWNSPVDDVPSPKYTTDTSSLPSSLAAYAEPTACGICVPTGELIDTRLSSC